MTSVTDETADDDALTHGAGDWALTPPPTQARKAKLRPE